MWWGRNVGAGFQLWSGDLPHLDVWVGDASYVLHGRSRPRGWTVYTNFAPPKGSAWASLPGWAILVTNGVDELFLSENAKKYYFELNSRDGASVSSEVTAEEAARIRHDIETEALRNRGVFVHHARRKVTPLRSAITYACDVRTLSASR